MQLGCVLRSWLLQNILTSNETLQQHGKPFLYFFHGRDCPAERLFFVHDNFPAIHPIKRQQRLREGFVIGCPLKSYIAASPYKALAKNILVFVSIYAIIIPQRYHANLPSSLVAL